MRKSAFKLLLAGTIIAGFASISAYANPLAASIGLSNGIFNLYATPQTVNGLPGTYAESVIGTYAITNTITSLTTPYNFVVSGDVEVDGQTVLSGSSPVLTGSVTSVVADFASLPSPYAPVLGTVIEALLSGSMSNSVTVDGFTADVAYNGGATGTFEIGSNQSLGSGVTAPASATFSAMATLTATPVPEPGSLALLGTGLLALGLLVNKRQKRG